MRKLKRSKTWLQTKGGDLFELCYYDSSNDFRYRSWKFSKQELSELIQWWGAHFEEQALPIENHRFGSLSISMVTPFTVEVRPMDDTGRAKSSIGFSLPRQAVEFVARERVSPKLAV